MQVMEQQKVKKVAIKKKDFEIVLEREGDGVLIPPPQPVHAPAPAEIIQKGIEHPAPKEEAPSNYIVSPIVGTFYAASSPDDPPFMKEGDRIEDESIVCIVEAMKVMNEVKAETKGVITEILVKNGDPVEFGTKLFRIT
ncbi:MAG: hypothetical protein S4CHLAM45_02030 [Chlamydiales bacterium]|nr:hypothetical protein [Chlamydiales bacterium]MCH9622326.1 hypothetical protein [Chlamydiales bacterium]